MITCKTCGVEKPEEAFSVQKSKRNGRFSECKTCQRLRNQAWIDNNRDRFRCLNREATSLARRRDPVRAMLCLARSRAKKAKIDFNLTEADVFIPSHCPVLGIELTFGLGKGLGQSLAERDSRASLDRIDNRKGYIVGNVVVVSYRANRIKSDATANELIKVARFYAKLDTDKTGKTYLPMVQQQPQEQAGSQHECDVRRNDNPVPLPPLRRKRSDFQ